METKYYIRAAIMPSIIAFLGNVLYGLIDAAFSNYKSEWLTAGSMTPILILMGVLNSAIFCACSFPIFLNRYKQIRLSLPASAAAWFLCPLAWLTIILVKTAAEFELSNGIDSTGISYLINIVPYPVALLISFWQFCHKIKIEPGASQYI